MKPRDSYIPILTFCLLLCFILPIQASDTQDLLDKRITLPRSRGTIFQLFNLITEKTELLFIYDSRIINNEQKSFIAKGEYSIREAIHIITGNPSLSLRLIDHHILIHLPEKDSTVLPEITEEAPVDDFFTITGTLYDKETQEPIIYASVGVSEAGIGTITNQQGEFRLKLPSSLRGEKLHLSHIGYLPEDISCEIIANKYSTFSLEPNVFSLQEIVVQPVNPLQVISDMLDHRSDNYMEKPVYLTSFYREGIESRRGMVSLTEGIFKVVKTPYNSRVSDQVKLLKMRKVSDTQEKDTVITKIKSGINACLMLDMVKRLPDFLRAESESQYNYTHSAITVIDTNLVDVISFTQTESFKEPLYRGDIYIDKTSKALLKVEFEIHPDYVKKATNMFVERKSKNLQIIPQEIKYTVSYKKWDNKYYINHVRGDLLFRIRKKKLFSFSTNVHTWFEMVTCKVETEDVSRFARSETLSTRTVFAETQFKYDDQFWGDFNIIIPENELSEAIQKISSKIEEISN